jgi:hypothetical protein
MELRSVAMPPVNTITPFYFYQAVTASSRRNFIAINFKMFIVTAKNINGPFELFKMVDSILLTI